MAISRENPVALQDLSDGQILSMLYTLGFTLEESVQNDAIGFLYSNWREGALIDEARRRGFIVEMRVSKIRE